MSHNKTQQAIESSLEYRSFAFPVEMRADNQYFGGLGALYYDGTPRTEAKLWEGMVERFYPGTFDEFLRSTDDCFCSFNHNIDRCFLARRASGTLEIESVSAGLQYRAKYDPADPDHQSVFAKIKRGDVRGSSVIFRVLPDGEDFSMEKGNYVRHVRSAWIMDIGPTHMPVYEGTTAEPRSGSNEPQRWSNADEPSIIRDHQARRLLARARKALGIAPPTDVELWFPKR